MNSRAVIPLFRLLPAAAALLAGCAYIKHVPPGQSLSEAMAQKATLVSMPAPPPQPAAAASAPLVAPGMQTEKVADAFTLGNLCLQQGRYKDAIAAFQSALKDDPSFGEAWNNLAIAYQDAGQEDKAMEAFRKYKMVAAVR
jgi:Flp pilus assembly protein TadD